jgi:hypothetical protein
MAHTIDQVTQQWVDNMTTGSTKNIRAGNVYYEGDTIYSYGSHFPLATVLRDKAGALTGFLVNGDTFSVSTGRHQRSVRSDIQRSKVPSVIIPFSALEAADIVRGSIKVLDVLPDRWEEKSHASATMPDGAVWHREPVTERRRKPDEDLAELVAARQATWDRHYAKVGGPRIITVDDLDDCYVHEHVTVRHNLVLRTRRQTWSPEITVHDVPDGTKLYTWDTKRHWLGESLIEATVRQAVRVTCPSCRGRRHRKAAPQIPPSPLRYQLFRDRLAGKGVDLGNYESWHKAHDRHETRRLLAQEAWWEQWGCKRCKGVGRWSKTVTRRAKFLSGFDRNEDRQTYFFCEMPKAAATTVAAALEALKPDTVRIAEQMGRLVRRQGDIFAVELTGLDKRKLRKRAAVFTRQGRLFGTNHVATETAALPDGTLLARGCLTHKPSGRAPDHARIRLAGGWYVVVKNTVPLTAA